MEHPYGCVILPRRVFGLLTWIGFYQGLEHRESRSADCRFPGDAFLPTGNTIGLRRANHADGRGLRRGRPEPSQHPRTFATNGWPGTTVPHGADRGRATARLIRVFSKPNCRQAWCRDPSRRGRERHPTRRAEGLPPAVTDGRLLRGRCGDHHSTTCRSCPEIALPSAARQRVAVTADIGFRQRSSRFLLRFATKWWADHRGLDLADLSFLVFRRNSPDLVDPSHPASHPVLTGWFAGPKAETVSSLAASELVEIGIVLARRNFRSISRQHQEGCRRVASAQLGQATRSAARAPTPIATPKNTGSAVSTEENRIVGPYSLPARRSMPARIWARSRRPWPAD